MYGIRFFLIAVVTIVLASPADAVVNLSGEVYDGFGGPLTPGTYSITDDLLIPRGESLTIQAGAVIKINHALLKVRGGLTVAGDPSNPVIFTSNNDNTAGERLNTSSGLPQPGDWQRVSFEPGSIGNIAHTHFRYGGDGLTMLDISSSVTLTDCEFRKSGSNGMTISNEPSELAVVKNCVFLENAGAAIHANRSDSLVTSEFQNNTAQGNHADVISVTGTIKTSGVIASKIPIFFAEDLTIGDFDPDTAGITVDVSPGVVFKARASRIVVNDQFNIRGTQESPVTFTSEEDAGSDAGGDTKSGDNHPAPGQWKSVNYMAKSKGNLSHTQFRYGGVAGAVLEITSAIDISDCTFAYNASSGLTIANVTDHATIKNCVFKENGNYAVYTKNPNALMVNHFENNSAHGNRADVIFATGEITKSGTLQNSIPIFFDAHLKIGDTDETTPGIIVNVSPGVIFKSNSGSVIVNDQFNVDGSQDNPVIFTSDQDTGADAAGDTLAGDNLPGPGQWGQILFQPGSSGSIIHSIFRYGGAGFIPVFENYTPIRISDSAFYLNSGTGISANADTTLVRITSRNNGEGLRLKQFGNSQIYGGIIQNCTGNGITILDQQSLTALDLTICGNRENGVEISTEEHVSISKSNILTNTGWGVLMKVLEIARFSR